MIEHAQKLVLAIAVTFVAVTAAAAAVAFLRRSYHAALVCGSISAGVLLGTLAVGSFLG